MTIDVVVTDIAGIASAMMGIVAIAFIISARRRMSNPELLGYAKYVLWVVISLTLFSSWHTTRELLGLYETYGSIVEIPEYGLVIVTCMLLLAGAWAILKMSRQYGFKEQSARKGRGI